MKVGVVVPVLNNFQGAIECLWSLKSQYQLEFYIQPQWRAQVPLAQAWNTGIDQAIADGCKFILVTNDDILFSPYTVDHMIEAFSQLPDNVVMVSANNLMGQLANPFDILSRGPEQMEDPFNAADHPNYSCFMVHKDFFDRVGRFDENFVPAWWEDNDSHYRIHLLGLRAICTTYASCIHYGGVSTAKVANPDSSRSEGYYRAKWGSTRRDMNEMWTHPYNDPELTPKDWRPNFGA